MLRHYVVVIIVLCTLWSCEKAEDAIVLPATGDAKHGLVEMGANYENQLFYDFETGTVVYFSDHRAWDLAFEASAGGRHVFMNGGDQSVFLYNTHKTSFDQVTGLPQGLSATGYTGWLYDDPTQRPSGTAVGDWWQAGGATKGEVYLAQTPTGVNKFRILSCNDTAYQLEWLPLSATTNPNQVQLHKDTSVNFVYFSFTKGTKKLEPPKESWDVLFTRCRDTILEKNVYLPYIVTAVVTNPYHTLVAADSVTDFAAIDINRAMSLQLTDDRLAIGYDWKTWDFIGRYSVNRQKCFVIKTKKEQLYKLHFLDFYNSGQVKGSPSFEYVRLK